MKANFQIKIPKRSSHCAVCGSLLEPGAAFTSLVAEGENEWERKDFHDSCWTGGEKGGMHWSSKVPEASPQEAPPELTRDEKGLKGLKECLASEGKEFEAQAYVLALYLTRRKQLVLRKHVRRKKGLFLVYEDAGGEETYVVYQPALSPQQLAEVEKKLAQDLLK